MLSDRDLRRWPRYIEVRDYFHDLNAVGQDRICDAADVSLSPDGKVAALTATVHADITRGPNTRICLVQLDSAVTKRIHEGQGNDQLARWSPDGRQLAFLSDRQQRGNFQLYHCAADGRGELIAAPPVEGSVESLQWSPDGCRILLLIAGFGADMAGCQGGATVVKNDQDADLPEWAPIVDTGDAQNLWRSLWIYDLAAGVVEPLATPGTNCWEACWLGNDRICAVTSASHSEGSWYRACLSVFDRRTGKASVRYMPADQIGMPAANASADKVALIEAVCSDRMIVAGNLLVIEARTGIAKRLDTKGVDVTQASWRDEHHLVFAGQRGLETVVGEIDLRTGSTSEHWSSLERTIGNWLPSMCPAPGGGCVAVAEAFAVAPELVSIREGNYRVVVSFDVRDTRAAASTVNTGALPDSKGASNNAARRTQGRPLATVEPVTWQARDGLEMQGWLVKPSTGGPFPLVMDIHGGPIWACRNRWQGRLRGAQLFTEHGCAVFYPNPRGSSGRGLDFARLVVGDMGGEDTYDYLTGLDALVAAGIADPQRLGVTGISYGGFMSAWLITQDTRFAATVPISCVSNWYSQHRTSQIPYFDELFLNGSPYEPGGRFFERSPVMYAQRVRTPTLQLTGALDQNTPPTQALEYHRSLLENGVRSVLVTYPTAGHGIRGFPEVIDATARYVDWFLEHFGLSR